MKPVMLLLAVAYPVAAHLAALRHSDSLALLAICIPILLMLLPALFAGKWFAWVLLPVAGLALALASRFHAAWVPLFAPPLLFNFLLAWLFGRTLLAGEIPFIERLARLLHDPNEILDPQLASYTRRLTLAWTMLFCAMGSIALYLALCAVPGGILQVFGLQAPRAVKLSSWSFFANVLNYLIVGLFFLGEYLYRKRRFPRQPYRNLFDFIRRSAAIGRQALYTRRS